jgi:hypothetical protein
VSALLFYNSLICFGYEETGDIIASFWNIEKVSFNYPRALPDWERRERGMNSCKQDMEFLSYCNKECFIGVGGSS